MSSKEPKRIKKGFSIELYTRSDIEDYTVYFEQKHDKIIFCYIQDSFTHRTFKGKAVCHKDDVYDIKAGRISAFSKALEKRDLFYDRMTKDIVKQISDTKKHNTKIEHKFNKFNEKN